MLKTLEKPKARKTISTEFVTVTPEIAEAWLDHNDGNRKVKTSVVEKYARDMEAGKWELTGDPIRFDHNAVLIDGQHRLMACVRAKKPFKTVVMYGLEPVTKSVIDTGKVRSIADVVTMMGAPNSVQLTSTARLMMREKSGNQSNKGFVASHSEVIEFLERHPTLGGSVRLVANLRPPKGIPITAVTMVHYCAAVLMNKREQAETFVKVFNDGIPTYNGDPAHACRERLIRIGTSKYELRRNEAINAIKHAWNLFVMNEESKTFKVPAEVKIAGLDYKKL